MSNKPKGIPMKEYTSNQRKKIVLILNKVKNKKVHHNKKYPIENRNM